MNRYVLLVLFLVHAVVSDIAMWKVGYIGLFQAGVANWGSAQIFSDLCVSLVLMSAVIVPDARKHGLNPWPWVLAMLPLGSFASLGYLGWRTWQLGARAPAVAIEA
jgi:hypothetical protein